MEDKIVEQRKVVIDCDPGIDDTLALIYALKNPKLKVVGITIVAGNVPVSKGVKNAQFVLNMLNMHVPIYIGDTSNTYISAEDTHGYNGMGNYDYGSVSLVDVQEVSATSYLAHFTEEDQVTLIALGPLTNVWGAYRKNPMLFHNMLRTYIMGGAYRTCGNCTPVSEYNFWCDPESAKNVFEVMSKTVIVPLDVTRKVVLSGRELAQIKSSNPTMGNFVEKITAYYMDFHWKQEGISGCVINDPLVVFVASTSATLQLDSYYAVVCDNPGITRGQMVVDDGNLYHKLPNCAILNKLSEENIYYFWKEFIEIICK